MKQRFSSLDVKVIAHELSTSLVSLRLSNIYDLSSKILLLKFAKPENKKQMLIDSGFRCHLTDFARTTAAAPSIFVQKLRKFLKTRRVTAVSQIGTDRIIEFQFSDGQFRLYLEFFASGNVILTDSDLKILTLLRNVPEGEGQEPQRPGLSYSLENRQNYGGVPPLVRDRVRDALQATVAKNAAASSAGKKIKKKPGDELRKGLATTITELPPILVDHAMKITGFDSKLQPAAVLENDTLLDHLLQALGEARKIVDSVTTEESCKGYIMAKRRPGSKADSATQVDDETKGKKSEGLLYEDFHPFLPRQFEEDTSYKIITFENFNKMADEFFSSIEGQKLESRLTEREQAAKRKLDAAKADQAKRIEGLQATQQLNIRKAEAIETNVERVQEAMDAVNGLIQQGMDWVNIGKLVEREQRNNNPVASIIKLPMKLEENTITVLLGEAEEEEDDDEADETDSEASDSDDEDASAATTKQRASDKRLSIDIDLGESPWSNARQYYDEKKTAAVKEQKTAMQSSMALKNTEQKIAAELKKGLKQEKPTLQPIRKQMWFEKFLWFISTDGYLVLGGRDASQNEMLYRRQLKKGDIYVHADLRGAASIVIKNNPSTPDAPIPPSTLSQAGSMAVCSSSAWDQKAAMSAWWVTADQVSKSAETGEYLPTGSFMVRGKKNFLPAAQLVLGLGLMFKVSEESKAKHVKHRLYDPAPVTSKSGTAKSAELAEMPSTEEPPVEVGEEKIQSDSDDGVAEEDDGDDDDDNKTRANPLQSSSRHDDGNQEEDEAPVDDDQVPTEEVKNLEISGEAAPAEELEKDGGEEGEEEAGDDDAETTNGAEEAPSVADTTASTVQTTKSTNQSTGPGQPNKGQQPKRGQRKKAKKIAAKYKDQDEDDRAAVEALIGSASGKKKAEAAAKAKEERAAQEAAIRERRRQQHQRQQRETAEHEEVRKLMLEEGMETLDADEAASVTVLDSLVGTPLPGDEILEVVVVCGPYGAMGRCKYKVKMQPGTQKKGKAVREVLEAWKAVSGKKGVVDEKSLDKEKMWPREVELLKGLKHEDFVNIVPVSSLRVMMSGGGSGGGGGGGGGKGGKGKGGRGGKKK